MRAYPRALRVRAVETYEQGEGTFEAVAQRFKIGVRTLKEWVALKKRTGDVAPRKAGGGRKPAFDAAACAALRAAVKQQPDATLEELRAACGIACSPSTVGHTLKRLRLPRKKNGRAPKSKTGRT